MGELGWIPGLGRAPGGGHGNQLQYPSQENPQGQRNLAGYSPWGRKESDTTKQLSTHPCEPDTRRACHSEQNAPGCLILIL